MEILRLIFCLRVAELHFRYRRVVWIFLLVNGLVGQFSLTLIGVIGLLVKEWGFVCMLPGWSFPQIALVRILLLYLLEGLIWHYIALQ